MWTGKVWVAAAVWQRMTLWEVEVAGVVVLTEVVVAALRVQQRYWMRH